MPKSRRHIATHLTTSRHGMLCLRIPIPRNTCDDPRKFLQLSLDTRDPDKAGKLSRAIQVETEAFMEHMGQMVRDADGTAIPFAELKSRIEAHYRQALEVAKAKRSVTGPSDDHEWEAQRAAEVRDMPNRDYWRLVGKDTARSELTKLCDALGIPMPSEPEAALALLDHIREAQKAAAEAMLEHSQDLRVYRLTEPRKAAPASAPASSQAVTKQEEIPSLPDQSVALFDAVGAFLRHGHEAEGWVLSTYNKRQAILEVLTEWFGPDCAVFQIDKRAAAAFKTDCLFRLPANRMTAPQTRDLSLRDSLEVSNVPKISNATVNPYLGCCRML